MSSPDQTARQLFQGLLRADPSSQRAARVLHALAARGDQRAREALARLEAMLAGAGTAIGAQPSAFSPISDQRRMPNAELPNTFSLVDLARRARSSPESEEWSRDLHPAHAAVLHAHASRAAYQQQAAAIAERRAVRATPGFASPSPGLSPQQIAAQGGVGPRARYAGGSRGRRATAAEEARQAFAAAEAMRATAASQGGAPVPGSVEEMLEQRRRAAGVANAAAAAQAQAAGVGQASGGGQGGGGGGG